IEALPPRHDVARRVTWDLREFAGRRGYLELIDADAGIAYAWMALGRIDPPVVPLPKMVSAGAARAHAAEIARSLHLTDLSDDLQRLEDSASLDINTRAAAAMTLVSFGRDDSLQLLGQILADESQSGELREKIAQQLSSIDSDRARAALTAAIKPSSSRMQ